MQGGRRPWCKCRGRVSKRAVVGSLRGKIGGAGVGGVVGVLVWAQAGAGARRGPWGQLWRELRCSASGCPVKAVGRGPAGTCSAAWPGQLSSRPSPVTLCG